MIHDLDAPVSKGVFFPDTNSLPGVSLVTVKETEMDPSQWPVINLLANCAGAFHILRGLEDLYNKVLYCFNPRIHGGHREVKGGIGICTTVAPGAVRH